MEKIQENNGGAMFGSNYGNFRFLDNHWNRWFSNLGREPQRGREPFLGGRE